MIGPLPHLAIWLAAAALYRLVLWPLFCTAALDVEVLIINLYEQHAAPKEWVPLAHAALRWGPLPLGVAAFAAGLYRVAPWRPKNPLHALSPARKAAVGLALFLPFAAALVPLAVALSLMVCVEAFHWIEFQRDINPLVDDVLRYGPALVGPGLAVLALLLTRRILGARPRKRRGLTPLISRTVVAALAAAALLPMTVVLGAATPQLSRSHAPGRAAFEAQCGGCHFRTLSLQFPKSPKEWRATVERMQTKTGAITDADAELITAFLSENRSTGRTHVFRTRCLRCHGSTHKAWDDRPEQQWEDLVDRMARWSPAYFAFPERARLKEELIERYGDEGATVGESTEDWERFSRLADLCQDCHSVSWNSDRFRKADFAETRRMVVRMSTKLVTPLDPDEIDAFTADYRDLMADPERFDLLFPHDRPIPEPAPPDGSKHRQITPNRGGY